MLNFCTLFDINFAVQGIAMYESLRKHCRDFHLYIFAFCDECLKLLQQLSLDNVTVISLSEFEDAELLKVKPSRSRGEYCWTCSSSTILYCLQKFNLDACTYIDADLCFYADPQVLLDEMGDNAVLITEHRYTSYYDQSRLNGKYCVQFITFHNNVYGLRVLNWWRNACLEWCYNRAEDGKFGDQKYLDAWPERFEKVHVLENLGGGVAPWNLQQYSVFKREGKVIIREKTSGKIAPVIFCHYHHVKILTDGKIDGNAYGNYDLTWRQRRLLGQDYLAALRAVSARLHALNPHVPCVTGVSFNFKQWLRWLIKFRWSKRKGRYLKICGRYLVAPKVNG